jgi:hypothetical protein
MLVVCIFASALGALIMCLLVLRAGFSPISGDPRRADHDVLITRLGHAVAGACFATTAILATVLVARTPAPRVVQTVDPRVSERLTALDRDRHALGEQITALDTTVQTLREQMAGVVGGVQTLRTRLDQTETRTANAETAAKKAETEAARGEAALKRLSDELAQASAKARQAAATRPIAARPATPPSADVVVPPTPRPPARRIEPVEQPQETALPAPPPDVVVPAAPAPAPIPTPAPHPAPTSPLTAVPPKPVASTPTKPSAHTATKSAPAAAASAPQDAPDTNLADKVRKDWDTIRRGFSNAGDEFSSAVRQFGRRFSGRD